MTAFIKFKKLCHKFILRFYCVGVAVTRIFSGFFAPSASWVVTGLCGRQIEKRNLWVLTVQVHWKWVMRAGYSTVKLEWIMLRWFAWEVSQRKPKSERSKPDRKMVGGLLKDVCQFWNQYLFLINTRKSPSDINLDGTGLEFGLRHRVTVRVPDEEPVTRPGPGPSSQFTVPSTFPCRVRTEECCVACAASLCWPDALWFLPSCGSWFSRMWQSEEFNLCPGPLRSAHTDRQPWLTAPSRFLDAAASLALAISVTSVT